MRNQTRRQSFIFKMMFNFLDNFYICYSAEALIEKGELISYEKNLQENYFDILGKKIKSMQREERVALFHQVKELTISSI